MKTMSHIGSRATALLLKRQELGQPEALTCGELY
jgi:hypothetical protein